MVCPVSWERVQAGGSREGHTREGKGEKEKACKMGLPAKFSGTPATFAYHAWASRLVPALFWKETTKLLSLGEHF